MGQKPFQGIPYAQRAMRSELDSITRKDAAFDPRVEEMRQSTKNVFGQRDAALMLNNQIPKVRGSTGVHSEPKPCSASIALARVRRPRELSPVPFAGFENLEALSRITRVEEPGSRGVMALFLTELAPGSTQ